VKLAEVGDAAAADGGSTIRLTGKAPRFLGSRNFRVSLRFHNEQEMSVVFSTFIMDRFSASPPEADLGTATYGSGGSRQQISLASHFGDDFEIIEVTPDQSFLKAGRGAARNDFWVEVRRSAPVGLHEGVVKVELTSGEQSEFWLPYRLNVLGPVRASSDQVPLGLQRRGSFAPVQIVLNGEPGIEVEIEALDLKSLPLLVEPQACPRPSDSCVALQVGLTEDAPLGLLQGSIEVMFAGDLPRMPLRIQAFVTSADAEIPVLGGAPTQAADNASPQADLSAVLNSITNAPSEILVPVGTGEGRKIRWSVRNEGQVYGYFVMKADSSNQPFKAASGLVPAIRNEQGALINYVWSGESEEGDQDALYKVLVVLMNGQVRELADARRPTPGE